MAAIGNIDVSVNLGDREWKEVRDYLYNIGNDGDANPLDPTIFSPICVSTALALGGSADMCDDSKLTLRQDHSCRATTTSVMSYKAKNREKKKETLQIRRHAPVHIEIAVQRSCNNTSTPRA